ncbi:EcsC family protein [Winogradskyella aurantiaca]|uniref:EcsC family protein n=1 Tax=Winogradskyella aurantiaca TaxID=2219558 RepID=UPI000E1DC85D|nr:EcsC family protein [Winogradskyella aurantiaca]
MSTPTDIQITSEDLELIQNAKRDLENLGLLMRGFNALGNKIERGMQAIPLKQQEWLQKQVNKALMLAVKSNLATMEKGKPFKKPSSKTYKALVTTTGMASGAFGAATGIGTAIFASELVISTQLMMRAILDMARAEGEDLNSFDTQLAAMQVFALGGSTYKTEGMDTSYYTSRVALDAAIQGAASFMSSNGLKGLSKLLMGSGNPLVKLLGVIAGRFSVQVSEKFVMQAIPVAGALGGGSLNFLFINHFQTMARAHFCIRRLERQYGKELVMETYEGIPMTRES